VFPLSTHRFSAAYALHLVAETRSFKTYVNIEIIR
jgi:hypothetical protein